MDSELTIGWCTQPANSQLILQSSMKYLGLAGLAELSVVSCLNFLTKTPASDTVKGLPGYPVQNCPSSFPEGHPEVVCTVSLDLSFIKMKMLLCLKYSKI